MVGGVIGVGTDTVEVGRIRALIERRGERFVRKWFTPGEIEYCQAKLDQPRHLAGRLAAKEAVFKAMRLRGTGLVPWRDVEVVREPGGAPSVRLGGDLSNAADQLGVGQILISISHDASRANAVAVILHGPSLFTQGCGGVLRVLPHANEFEGLRRAATDA